MSDYDTIDFFTDQSLVSDPYPYFDHLRSQCPVLKTSNYGVVAVTGHEEASLVYKDGIETYRLPETVPVLEGQVRVF